MAAKFSKPKETRRQRRQKTTLVSHLRFNGPILAGLLVASTVFGAGKVLAWKDSRDRAAQSGERLVELTRNIQNASAFNESLERRDGRDMGTVLRKLLAQDPNMSGVVWNRNGDVVAREGPHSDEDNDVMDVAYPLGGQLVMGPVEGGNIVAHQTTFFHPALGDTGKLMMRTFVHAPSWAAWTGTLAWVSGLYTFLLVLGYLGRSMRGTNTLVGSLERIGKEEFWHKVPEMGSGEIQKIARTMNSTMDALSTSAVRVHRAYIDLADALARTVEAKDRYTSGHSQRVARYAVEMGKRLGFDKERLNMLYHGGLLHDIGKVATPDAVLLKPGPLTDEEFDEMKKHPMDGDKILGRIPGMRDVADIARSHHERWDGRGYPLGQAAEAIPLEGRIVAIADAYDSMVTRRSYKPAFPIEEALNRIEKDAGTHFDPDLARLFVAMKRNGEGYKAMKQKPSSAAADEGAEPVQASEKPEAAPLPKGL